jgi:MtN3 and saliva related transmembrane protein
MILTDIFGIIGAILSSALYLPQLIHIIKRKKADDLSYIFLILTLISSIFWIVYGIYDNSIPIIICDSFIFIITFIMIILKYHYRNDSDILLLD